MDGSVYARFFSTDVDHYGERSCVRPVGAVYIIPLAWSCQTNQLKHQKSWERGFYEVMRVRHSVRAASRFSLKLVRLSQRSTADKCTAPMALPGESGAAA